MSKFKIVSGLVLIFLAGAVCGGIAGRAIARHRLQEAFLRGPPAMGMMIMKHLNKELSLREDQRLPVAAALAQIQRGILDLRAAHKDEMQSIIDKGITQMDQSLDSEQQKRLGDLVSEMRTKLEIRAEHYPSPDGRSLLGK